MRRLPPQKVEQNLSGLINLLPEETDELLQRVDQPLKIEMDSDTGRPFLQCDYNRDGDSFRYMHVLHRLSIFYLLPLNRFYLN